MLKELIPFQFESNRVRVVSLNDEPWFVAKDILLALDYAESTIEDIKKSTGHVPEEWKGQYSIRTPGGDQKLWCFSEQGLYFFLGRSNKPKALPFQKWLAGEVVPSIRKTGQYKAGWWKARHESASSFKVMTDILKLARETSGKLTQSHHYINEARLVNWVMTGHFTALDRDSLPAAELNLLARLEERNACFIGMGMSYPLRKQALKEYLAATVERLSTT